MKLTLKNKTYTIPSFEAASLFYCDMREKSGQGASKFPNGTITDNNGKFLAHISYNGKVWASEKWQSGMIPLFDPRG